jgi:hypothetical protein
MFELAKMGHALDRRLSPAINKEEKCNVKNSRAHTVTT